MINPLSVESGGVCLRTIPTSPFSMGVKFCRLSALELKYQLFVAANRTFGATPQLFSYLKKNLILCFDPIDVSHLLTSLDISHIAHFLGMAQMTCPRFPIRANMKRQSGKTKHPIIIKTSIIWILSVFWPLFILWEGFRFVHVPQQM